MNQLVNIKEDVHELENKNAITDKEKEVRFKTSFFACLLLLIKISCIFDTLDNGFLSFPS